MFAQCLSLSGVLFLMSCIDLPQLRFTQWLRQMAMAQSCGNGWCLGNMSAASVWLLSLEWVAIGCILHTMERLTCDTIVLALHLAFYASMSSLYFLKLAASNRCIEWNELSPSPKVRKVKAAKRMKVDMHLLKLYQGAAGMLPNKFFGQQILAE